MNTNRIKVLGLLRLTLLAIAVAVMVFAFSPATDTTEAATDGASMSLSINGETGKVDVGNNSVFTVVVSADSIPTGTGYTGVQAWIDYGAGGLAGKGVDNVVALWGDCEAATFVKGASGNALNAGCLTGPIGGFDSFLKGAVFSFDITCDKDNSHTIGLLALGDPVAGTSGAGFSTSGGAVAAANIDIGGGILVADAIDVNCVSLGVINSRFSSLSSFTQKKMYTDENWVGFSDADANVKIVVSGCKMLGTADALVEDGKSAVVTTTAGPGNCKLRVTYKNCQTGTIASVTLKAIHSINYTAALPGGTVSSSFTFSGTTESLDVTTSFKVTFESSAARTADSFTTTNTTGGELKAHVTLGIVELEASVNTSSSRKRSVAINAARTDAKMIFKPVTKVVDVVCGQTREFSGSSSMSLTLSSDGTSRTDTADIPTTAEAVVNNKMSVVSATVSLNSNAAGFPTGDLLDILDTSNSPENTVAGTPQLIPGRQTLLANAPQNLIDAHLSSIGNAWSVFVPDNKSSALVDLTSGIPSVALPSTATLKILPGEAFGVFNVAGVGAGATDIEAAIPSLAFEASAPVDVLDFQQLVDQVIFPTGEAKIQLVEGTSERVVLNRQPFRDMKTTSTVVLVTPANSSIVSVSGDPTFGLGETTSVVSVTGEGVGTTTVTVLQPQSGQQFSFTVNVVPETSVDIEGGSDFTVGPHEALPLAILLSDDLPSDLKVTISSSNPDVVSVENSSVLIPAGSKIAGFDLTSRQEGQTTISMTTPLGISDEFVVTVTGCPLGEIKNLSGCKAVGGVAADANLGGLPLEAAGSAGSSVGLLAGIVGAAAGALALGGAGWFARRRRMR